MAWRSKAPAANFWCERRGESGLLRAWLAGCRDHRIYSLALCLGWLAGLFFRIICQPYVPWITGTTRFPNILLGFCSLICCMYMLRTTRWGCSRSNGVAAPYRFYGSDNATCLTDGSPRARFACGLRAGFCSRLTDVCACFSVRWLWMKSSQWPCLMRPVGLSFLSWKPWTNLCRALRGAWKHVRESSVYQPGFCWVLLLLLAPLGLYVAALGLFYMLLAELSPKRAKCPRHVAQRLVMQVASSVLCHAIKQCMQLAVQKLTWYHSVQAQEARWQPPSRMVERAPGGDDSPDEFFDALGPSEGDDDGADHPSHQYVQAGLHRRKNYI